MSWTTLSADDVLACLAAPQADVLRQRFLKQGQADPLPGILAEVTARVRGDVCACRKNVVPRNATLIPPELKLAAARLTVEALQTRLPTLALTPDQVRAAEEARQLLERVAAGETAVSRPDSSDGETIDPQQYGAEVVRRRRRCVDGEKLSRL